MKKLDEEMKSLKQLELTIPKLDVISSKSIMGGDGYMEMVWDGNDWYEGELDDVVVRPEQPDHPDFTDLDTEPTHDMDNDWDNDNGEQGHGGFSWENISNVQARNGWGTTCAFIAAYALLAGYGGDGSKDGWLKVATDFVSNLPAGSDFNATAGLDITQTGELVDQNFTHSDEFTNISGLEGLATGEYDAVFGMIDTDDDGSPNHAVDIKDYDPETGEFGYWDPEDGGYHTGSGDDFKGGWGITGTR